MESLLEGKPPAKFKTLTSVCEFIDGFELRVNEEYTGPQLQRQLKDVGLDVKSPIAKRTPGTFWIQLQNGPYDVAHN